MPLVAALSLLIIGLTVWGRLRDHESQQVRQAVRIEAENFREEMVLRLEAAIRSIRAMAGRWQVQGGTPRRLWEADAQQILQHEPGYRAVAWQDRTQQVRWILPPGQEQAISSPDLLFSETTQLGSPGNTQPGGRVEVSRIIPLASGEKAVVVRTPLFIDREFDGFLLGLIGLESLLGPILSPEFRQAYSVAVFEGPKVVYSTEPADLGLRRQMGATLPLNLDGVRWEVSLWPRPPLMAQTRSPLPWVVLGGSATLAVVFALTLHFAFRARLRARQLEKEVAARKQREEDLRKRAEAIVRKQKAALELRQLGSADLRTSVQKITEVAAATLEVERVAVWLFTDDREELLCQDLYNRSRGSHERGARLRARNYPEYVQALETKHTVPVEHAAIDPITRELATEYLIPYGISSMMDAPVRLHGEVVGVVCHEHTGLPRKWTLEEQDFAVTVADAVDLSLEASRRRQTEEKVWHSERRFHVLLESAPDAIVIVDAEGKITLVNEEAERMFGYERDEVLGHPLEILLPNRLRQAHRRHFLQYVSSPRRRSMGTGSPLFGCRKDGSEFPIEASLSPIRMPDGRFVISIIRDISERRELEEQLFQSQKMEAIGRLAGGVAHDFNNLLTVIVGYADFLLSDMKADHPHRTFVTEVLKAAERAASLTQQLLAFSRRQVLQPRVLNLNDVVSNLEKMLRRLIGEDIELVIRLEPGLESVRADPGRMEQMIMNLAVNARDAMPAGGKLTIETANVHLDEDYARRHLSVEPGPYVMIAVSDTGEGMDAETQANIFEPFFTTKEPGKGTGLGLSTVYGIVHQSGGDIWVYSEPGHGTTFKIYFPCIGDAAESVTHERVAVAPHKGNETVLLVEDDEKVRKVAELVLSGHGYQVLEAESAEKALYLAREHHGPIHLLITDVVLPGTSGPTLAGQLRSLRPEMRILYVSGYTDSAIGDRGMLHPNVIFLEKPFSPNQLIAKVRELLETS